MNFFATKALSRMTCKQGTLACEGLKFLNQNQLLTKELTLDSDASFQVHIVW